jgi:transposase
LKIRDAFCFIEQREGALIKQKESPDSVVRHIRSKTRYQYYSEEKIRTVLEALRGEDSIANICRRESINPNLYFKWSKDFLEAEKKSPSGDTVREANSEQVTELRKKNDQLKQLVAELALKNKVLKKFDWIGIKISRYMRYNQAEKMKIIKLVEQ